MSDNKQAQLVKELGDLCGSIKTLEAPEGATRDNLYQVWWGVLKYATDAIRGRADQLITMGVEQYEDGDCSMRFPTHERVVQYSGIYVSPFFLSHETLPFPSLDTSVHIKPFADFVDRTTSEFLLGNFSALEAVSKTYYALGYALCEATPKNQEAQRRVENLWKQIF